MADATKIEWADATWNPTVGCSVLSPGCTNCYAMRVAHRFGGSMPWSPAGKNAKYAGLTKEVNFIPVWTGKVRLDDAALTKPLSWRKPRRIFVNSMSDLFHESLPDEAIDRVFAVMALCPQHNFLVLTKRAQRMRDYLTARNGMGNASICRSINEIPAGIGDRHGALEMPLPNCWLGVSVEDQTRADERIPLLLDTPAAKRFISAEPLLGPVDLTAIGNPLSYDGVLDAMRGCWSTAPIIQRGGQAFIRTSPPPRLDWVIAGSESGPGARPCDLDWIRLLRDHCATAGVPFFWKQHVEDRRKISLPELDGRQWAELPV